MHDIFSQRFIEQPPYPSKRELRTIAAAHVIKYRSHLTIIMCKDVLRRHTRHPDCAGVAYKFHTLKRRRDVMFVPPYLDPPRNLMEGDVVRHDENRRRVHCWMYRSHSRAFKWSKRVEGDQGHRRSRVEWLPEWHRRTCMHRRGVGR